jgi:hypothetical protein
MDKLQATITAAANAVKPNIAAGSQAALQPGAYGGDKNASFFSDPSTRASFMAQFGIQGDAKTQQDMRTYQELQAAAAIAQQQLTADQQYYSKLLEAQNNEATMLKSMQHSLEMLVFMYGAAAAIAGMKIPIPTAPLGFATGGAFMVGGQAGPDANLVTMALTAGELVTVQTPTQQQSSGQSKNVIVNLNIATPNVSSFNASRASIANKTAATVAQALKQRA